MRTSPTFHGLSICCLAVVASLFAVPVCSQVIIELGTGFAANNPNDYPAPYGNASSGARHQMLIHAADLNAAGMTEGTIYSVAFNVFAEEGTPLQSFTISIGTTALTDLGPGFVAGLAPVFGPVDHTDVVGWNTHTFDTPYYWDGTSNLVVQTCFSNGFQTNNAQTYYSPTSYTSVVYRATGNPNVCTSLTGTIQPSSLRPDMQFEWASPMIPPTAAFTMSTAYSCDGVVQFTDASLFNPTGWLWDFGDGNTSTEQDPLHTYILDGTYTVTLIDTNAFGADTTSAVVVVNANGPQPVPACVPNSTGTVAGFGILEVNYASISFPSGDALTEGYADRGCVQDTVLAGSAFQLEVIAGTVTLHNIRAWADWARSPTFSSVDLGRTAHSASSATTTVVVPTSAVLDTPLRLRVMADYNFAPSPQPCTDLQFGQAEDYGLVVLANPFPPDAGFSATPTVTCDGAVQFTDASLNIPTGWIWTFGDGNGSTQQDPQYTYTTSGTYTVTLIAINSNGSDTLVMTDLIIVDLAGQLIPASCTPQTQSYCCGYGILGVDFAGIASTSVDGVEGYQDRSCGNTATVQEGQTYPISIGTGVDNGHDTYVWIDMNNDGDLAAIELVFFALNEVSPSGPVAIPAGSVYGIPLRMRVSTDVLGELTGPCDQPLYGQTEDFSVIVTQNTNPPVADFSASSLSVCEGEEVFFTDQSTNLPNGWSWDFGDGGNSTDQDPSHTYTVPGMYTVSLTASNGFGSDTQTWPGMIQVVEAAYCDTLLVPDGGGPGGGADTTVTACDGVMADDGGPLGDYSPGVSSAVTIAPPGAQLVILTFEQFAFETNTDVLRIFDGPTTASPLIGEFSGNGVGVLPNGGVISSTGPAITIQQAASPGMIVWEGFILNWECSYVGIAEASIDPLENVWPQPADDFVHLAFARPAEAGWQIAVHNTLGDIVATLRPAAGSRMLTFDSARLAAGCYALTLSTPEGRWSRTIILN